MKKAIYLIILLSITNSVIFSQITFQKTYNLGGIMDLFSNVQQATDGGYVITGTSIGIPPVYSSMIKVDSAGVVQWARQYGDNNFFNFSTYFLNDVKLTSDGGYILTGECSGTSCDDLFLIKTNSTGDVTWSKGYGGGNSENGNYVMQTQDGGYLAVGTSTSFGAKDSTNIYMVKTDLNGNMTWDRAIQVSPDDDDAAYAVEEASDGYIVVGKTEQVFAGVDTTSDIVILKTDGAGNVLWLNTYGNDFEHESATAIELINDGSIIVSGSTTESIIGFDASDSYVFDIDGTGNITWSSAYDIGFADEPQCVKKTLDGGYAIIGFTISNLFPLSFNSFLMKSASSGAIDFAMHYGTGMSFIFTDGQQTSDNGYVIGTIGTGTGYEYYLIKTDEFGNSNCNETPFSANKRNFAPPPIAAAHTDFSGGSDNNIPADSPTITPAVTTLCIDVPCDTPIVTIAPVNPTICEGQSVNLTASGADTYSWNTGATTATINVSPTSTTIYTVTGLTGGICPSYPTQVTVTVNPAPNVSISGTTTICNGQSTSLTASGGDTYAWDTGDNTAATTVSPTTNTTYNVTVTNTATGCTETASQLVTVNPVPSVSISGTTTICIGQSTTLTASGGNTYSWDTGDNTAATTVSPTTNTTYNVTVTITATGCTASGSQLVTVNALPSASISGTTTICEGSSTTLTASGGDTYAWDTGDNTAATIVSPASNTTYNVTVTNTATGCTATASQLVSVNPAPIVSISGTTTICDGQSTSLTASGGDTYAWDTGDNTAATTVSPTTNTTYNVTVTNTATGCTETGSQLVTVNALPSVSISGTITICEGASTTLTASGGDTYAWDTGDNTAATTVSPTVNTTYNVTVTNTATGCTASGSQLVTVNALPSVSISGTITICEGESTLLTASGGDTYAWDTGDNTDTTTVNPLLNTTYNVTVTSTATGCTATASQLVSVNPLPTITISGLAAICDGASTTITASGGDTYLWSTGDITDSTTVNPATDSTYYVTVTNTATGCTAIGSQLVSVSSAPIVSISGISTICDGESTTLTASGGDIYLWDNSDTTAATIISPTGNTTYYVTVTDGTSGCFTIESQLVTVNALPNIAFAGDTSLCIGEATTINVSGGDTYLWNTGDTLNFIILTPLVDTDYYVTVTDTNSGCFNKDTLSIYVHPLPVAQATGTDTICEGVSLQLTASGGTSYSWSPVNGLDNPLIANPVATVNSTTVYTVTVFNDFGCYDTASVTISINPAPQFTLVGTNIDCNGAPNGTASINIISGIPPFVYIWNNLDTSSVITNLNTGNYSVTVTDAIGCTAFDTILITEPLPLADSVVVTNVSCNGLSDGMIELIISGGNPPYNYLWNDSSSSSYLNNLPEGTYSVTITDINGCIITLPKIDVTQPPIILLIFSTQNVYCYGGNNATAQALAAGGAPPYTYIWSDGQTASTSVSLTSGLYLVTITDANGCSKTGQTTITEPLEMIYTEEISPVSCIGNYDGEISIAVYGGTQPYTYIWTNQQSDSLITELYAGEYIVTVTDYNDCYFVETFELTETQISCLEIPTLFTPNGDGANDYWEIKGIELYPEVIIEVYSRWGDIVFESEGYNQPWDGTFKGKKLPLSSYVFIITLNNDTEPIQGIVTIKY